MRLILPASDKILGEFRSLTKGINFLADKVSIEEKKLKAICGKINELSKEIFLKNPSHVDYYVIFFKAMLVKDQVTCKSNNSNLSADPEVKELFLKMVKDIGPDFKNLCHTLQSCESDKLQNILIQYFNRYDRIVEGLYLSLNRYNTFIMERQKELERMKSSSNPQSDLGILFSNLDERETKILYAHVFNERTLYTTKQKDPDSCELGEFIYPQTTPTEKVSNILASLTRSLFLNNQHATLLK